MIYNSAIPQRPNVSRQMLKNSNVLISLSFCCSRTIRYPGVSSTTCCLIALASNEVRTDNATWAGSRNGGGDGSEQVGDDSFRVNGSFALILRIIPLATSRHVNALLN